MIVALLFTFLPTLLFYILLKKTRIKIKSLYLKISLAWFLGIYISTFIIFIFACLFSFITNSLLLKACFLTFGIICLFLIYFYKEINEIKKTIFRQIKDKKAFNFFDLFIISFCLLFSFFVFNPHLAYKEGKIYTSPIYWDFHWHVGVIQNFAFGDNFLPQNESFSGIPQTYHFFGDLVVANYEVLGLNLVTAMNFVSILVFFFILMTLIGCAEEIFHSKKIGIIAVILSVTTSNEYFIYNIFYNKDFNLSKIISDIFHNTGHTWISFYIPGLKLTYSGVMQTLFYLIEERHLMFGIIYLLLCVWIISKREEISSKKLFIIGCLMGTFFLWHLYICAMVLCSLVLLFIIDKERKKTLWLIGGFSLIFGLQYLLLKQIITNSVWFLSTNINYPKVDFSFSTLGEKYDISLMLQNAWKYWSYGYGLKIILLPLSLIVLWKKNRRVGAALTAVIVTAFIIINSLLVSPEGLADNHKFLRPMNFVIDLATAYIVYLLFFKKKKNYLRCLGIVSMFCLTISGIIELTPFINSRPTELYASYPSLLTNTITKYSPPKSNFIGKDTQEFHLAGRKLFIGFSAGPTSSFNMKKREQIVLDIYASKDIQTFCKITHKNKIDYVEFFPSLNSPISNSIQAFPHFSTVDKNNKNVLFADVKKGCL